MATIAMPLSLPSFTAPPQELAQSQEGKMLWEVASGILADCRRHSARNIETEAEDVSYRSVPWQSAGSVRVRYRYCGEMKPRRMSFDE